METLKDEKLNNRLVSELLAHPDFVRLMQAVEIYIDRKVVPQIAGMNALYQATQDTIQERFDGGDNDEIIAYLQAAMIDEDDYLRHRSSGHFVQKRPEVCSGAGARTSGVWRIRF